MMIEVDRIACRGDGLCAGLLPEAVTLDDWGFPIVGPLPAGTERAAPRWRPARPWPYDWRRPDEPARAA